MAENSNISKLGEYRLGKPQTLIDKIWESRLIDSGVNGDLIFIDLHLLNEVTSPQAYEGLKMKNRTVRHPELSMATADHNVPSNLGTTNLMDKISAKQLDYQKNIAMNLALSAIQWEAQAMA